MFSSQFKGIFFALAACCIWGLIFVVPQWMSSQGPFEVALGRYLFYGLISLVIFAKTWRKGEYRVSRAIFGKAIYFSLLSTLIYYTCLVFALRHATPAVSALILGISPITIAFYGNWRQKEVSFQQLVVPSCLIFIGLIAINWPHFGQENSSYVMGIVSSLLALAAWSWYVVANAEFLKTHPHIHPSNWSTLIGVATLLWVVLLFPLYGLFSGPYRELADPLRFWVGSAILGILCSWVGAFLWNRASLCLPVSLAGQLTVFETLFGLLFVYLLAAQFPPILELFGMSVIFIAVLREMSKALKIERKMKDQPTQE